MKYNKGDYIGEYRVLILLKQADGIETYRVRDSHGVLCALKIGVETTLPNRTSSLFMADGMADGAKYVVTRYVSGESLQARLHREGRCSVPRAKCFALSLLNELATLHAAGYAHNNINADNVMVDLSTADPSVYLTGYSRAVKADAASITNDIKALGALLYLMVFNVEPSIPPKLPNTDISGLDSNLLNVMHNAIAGAFDSVAKFADALSGKVETKPVATPMGPGFSAVAGLADIKQRLQQDVIDILANRDEAARYGIEIPNGMLLYGPPGCGKSFIAERFAEQAGYNYIYVKASDLASIYIHGSQEKIGELFKRARANAPTIICFDEFDALVPRRDDTHNSSQSGEVNEFLTQLNNCGRDGVFVIATTNRPDRIDSAVLRTGRFDSRIYVPLPDAEVREEILRIKLTNRPVDPDIDLRSIAEKTDGYLASDLTAIVQDAARNAFRAKSNITHALLLEALSRTRPSLSKSDIRAYESIRDRFEKSDDAATRPKLGFTP